MMGYSAQPKMHTKAYLQQFNVMDTINDMIMCVAEAKPENPLQKMLEFLDDKVLCKGGRSLADPAPQGLFIRNEVVVWEGRSGWMSQLGWVGQISRTPLPCPLTRIKSPM